MNRLFRYLMIAGAWMACILGCVGVFVPVLPTTPLLLLATFLFAKSSPRCHAWIRSTRVYKAYVGAFKQAGGIPASVKARIIIVSFLLMGTSAYFVQNLVVWVVLGCVAVFLLYLMLVRIPTVSANAEKLPTRPDDRRGTARPGSRRDPKPEAE